MLGFLLKQAEPSFNDDSFVFQGIGCNARALENMNVHVFWFQLEFALTICTGQTLFGIGRRVNFVCLSAHSDEGACCPTCSLIREQCRWFL